VAFRDPGQPERILAFLESQLIRVDPPRAGAGAPLPAADS
jgi:hypothetical protein